MHILPNGVATLGPEDILSREVAERGLVSDHMVRDLLPHIHQGDWVVDAGAALGDHTRAYLDAVGPRGKVFAFEPNPKFFECLTHNCPEAVTINRALYRSGDREFFLHFPHDNVGAGFLVVEPRGNPSENVSGVKTVRLDDYGLDKLNFFKLDCEGAEYYALLGAAETINRCRPIITLEMNEGLLIEQGVVPPMLIYQLLDSWRYDYKSIRNQPDRYCTMCDILAWPK